jgi:periplasmic protein TonB
MNGTLHDVYTAGDIAQVAGVPEAQVDALLARGEIRSISAFLPPDISLDPKLDQFVPHAEAVRVVRALRAGRAVGDHNRLGRLLPSENRGRSGTVPFLLSTTIHGAAAAAILIIASLGWARADAPTEPLPVNQPVRMIFLMQPGPGGGGGGGGRKIPSPPPMAERKGVERMPSPLPARRLPPPVRPPEPVRPPPPPLETKTIVAPVVTAAADQRDREGVIEKVPEPPKESPGPGAGQGVGTGQGSGIGEGAGPGIGPGEGGGTGGGPYRPGSGVDPPRLLREVRADYTDEARRAGVTGEVLLEIVVRRDGNVGDVKVLRGLNAGLDQRAIQAVRQWRFAPARLKSTPVDVVVEVAVEFKLR